jgi:4-amino-4-deoxy-L-arabinose transferase-like glycosyltransferase
VAELSRRRRLLALAAITAGGAALRFATLDLQSFWNDEVFTASLVSGSFSHMWDGIKAVESTPPVYYVAAWLWAKVFGTGEVGLRSLSAVAGTLLIPVVYAAAATLVSQRAGLVTAGLAATSPLLVWYSQEARAYSLMLLLSATSFLFFARSTRELNWPNLAGWVAFSVAAVATHYFAAFVVIAEAGALIILRGLRRAVLGPIVAIGLGCALLLPLWNEQVHQQAIWVADIPLDLRLEEAVRQLATPALASPWAGAGRAGVDSHDLWWLAAVLLALAGVLAVWLGTRSERRGALIAGGIGAASVLIPLAIGLVGEPIFDRGDYLIERNVLGAWVPLAILVAAGLGARRAGIPGLAAIVALCAAGVALVLAIDATPTWQRDDWRQVASRLASKPTAVLVVPAYQANPLRFYDRGLRDVPGGGIRTRVITIVHPGSSDPLLPLPSAFEPEKTERVGRWEIEQLRSPFPVALPAHDGLLVQGSP